VAKKRVGKFPKAFRQMAVDRLNQCDNIGELANLKRGHLWKKLSSGQASSVAAGSASLNGL